MAEAVGLLRIASGLALPADAVTQAMAFLARRGAGKTYAASVLVEEMIGAHLPVVVLDPMGAWWGLRSSADGERPGLPVVILGGEHGDVPLEPTAGKVIAEVVISHPGAYVIDLSGFESKAAEQRFVADFLERLYRAKAKHPEPLFVVLDEADAFAPQRPGGEQLRTLGAVESIVRRGRIRGLGILLITQRAAVLNKNVLTQTEVLVVLQTTGPQDRDAIDEWIKGNGTAAERAEVLGSLASLEQGEAWVWSPSWLRTLKRIRIRTRRTFDSSRTPEAGAVAAGPRAFAKVNLAALGEQIAASVEQAKANDPAELRRRITHLEGIVRGTEAALRAELAKPAKVERVEVVREVPVLSLEDHALMRELETRLAAIASTTEVVGNGKHYPPLARPVPATPRTAAPSIPSAVPSMAPTVRRTSGQRSETPEATGGASGGSASASLGKAERSILAALAAYPVGLTREQLAFLAGYHPRTPGFANALGALRSAGLVEAGFPAYITQAGRDAMAAAGIEPATVPPLEAWMSRFGKAERLILGYILDTYPTVADRQALADATGYHPRTPGFANALGKLRGLGLVDGYGLDPAFAQLLGR